MIQIVKHHSPEGEKLLWDIKNRGEKVQQEVQKAVDMILQNIQEKGDEALFGYTKEWDGYDPWELGAEVTQEEIEEAKALVSEQLVGILKKAKERIWNFHQKQKNNSWLEPSPSGEMLGQLIRPLERVGIYVPGGKASYPSSVLMNAVPAKVAGVKEIIMTTPVGKNGKISPMTIVAAEIAGVDRIFKIGGAQAIGAMAYGTQSVPKVDKICGPGNIYVALAKKSVFGTVGIDSVAGPSEILVLADETANPVFVAADLLSQAEHDELASSILITDSQTLAEGTLRELLRQTAYLPRKEIIEASLKNYGAIVVTDSMEETCDLANQLAPEHLEVCTKDPFALLPKIQNAGAIFLGHYTPEPLGDYMAGPNHVLPTGGSARFFSPLSVDDFIKKSSILSFSPEAFSALQEDVIAFAQAEGLYAHANAVQVRCEKNQ